MPPFISKKIERIETPGSLKLQWALLFLITSLAAFLRLNACLQTEVQFPLRADAGEYFSYAYNVNHYGVYSREPRFATDNRGDRGEKPLPDAVRSPGYPLFLLPFSSHQPTDRTILHITLTQCFLGILMVPMGFFLSRRFLASYWALLPCFLIAISPQLTIASTYVLTESLFAFALLAMICTLVWQNKYPAHLGPAIAAGAIIGVASLIRPTTQYFLPFYLACTLPALPVGRRLRQALFLIAGFAMTFAPWLLRNIVSLGVLSDSTLTINTLVHGHYPSFMFEGRPESYGFPYRYDPRANELSQSVSKILGEITNNIRSDPLNQLKWFLIDKPIALLSWGDPQAGGTIFTYPVSNTPYLDNPAFLLTLLGMQLTHPAWMVLSVLGTITVFIGSHFGRPTYPREAGLEALSLVALYFVMVHIAGFPLTRYAVPLLPILYILATFFLAKAVKLVVGTLRNNQSLM